MGKRHILCVLAVGAVGYYALRWVYDQWKTPGMHAGRPPRAWPLGARTPSDLLREQVKDVTTQAERADCIDESVPHDPVRHGHGHNAGQPAC